MNGKDQDGDHDLGKKYHGIVSLKAIKFVWICPGCHNENMIANVESEVKCYSCGLNFIVTRIRNVG